MKRALFRYIHVSDFHLCIEPRRRNVLELFQRNPRSRLDTLSNLGSQTYKHGARSVLNPASYEPGQLSGVARFCNDWSDRIDGILLTGDLCTTGLIDDLKVADVFLRQPATAGVTTSDNSPTISKLRSLVRLLPGNHDRYKDNSGTPNSNLFDLKFDEFMPNFRDRVGYWVDSKQHQTIVFVFADFSIRSKGDVPKGLHLGRGKVYEDILSAVIETTVLQKSKYRDAHVVWVIHFAPYDCGSTIQLDDAAKFTSAARTHGVAVVLNGHTHSPMFSSDGQCAISSAGASCAIDVSPFNTVHLIEFEIGSASVVLKKSNFLWNEEEQLFSFSDDQEISL
jgi:3',5'-cyclic AMP phosphodiesterase CpdA